MSMIRFRRADVAALDTNGSGHVTVADHQNAPGKARRLAGTLPNGMGVELAPHRLPGTAARIFEYVASHGGDPVKDTVEVPLSIAIESPTERALLAADSYDSSLRTMRPGKALLDLLLARPDPKLGVFGRGLRDEDGRFCSYRVVTSDGVAMRQATYDGSRLYLYVPSGEAEALAAFMELKGSDPRYAPIEITPISREQVADPNTRLELRFDRPGLFWISTDCPLLPDRHEVGYVVPGGRFGLELYYHDARLNLPGARSTVEALKAQGSAEARGEALKVLSAMRGTTNALVNQVWSFGKVLNGNLTVYASRSQPPCLTTCIRETYAAWASLAAGDPQELADARTWLAWAAQAAETELREVWRSPPRLDPVTGLSRYVDELPTQSPEEDQGYYRGRDWSAGDLASDAAIREHGWDSNPAAIILFGPESGQPRAHHLLPVCLNSLLFKYETDLAEIAGELGHPQVAAEWRAKALERKATMEARMWDETTGLFHDLYYVPGGATCQYRRNLHEDLRSFTPMWAGLVEAGSPRAAKMRARVNDFEHPGGLAGATSASYARAMDLNPKFTQECQWGTDRFGWPISNAETAQALRQAGFVEDADRLAYKWAAMVQETMESHGGLQYSDAGGYEATVMEKMDVQARRHDGLVDVNYGNQGAGFEGDGGGFRWGYDAFKLLVRSLSPELQKKLAAGRDPRVAFGAEPCLVARRR